MLVEIKLSKGAVVHRYEKQLEVYKKAANTDEGIFVVLHVGDIGNKLTTIQAIRDYRLGKGEPASTIELIDVRPKASASKTDD